MRLFTALPGRLPRDVPWQGSSAAICHPTMTEDAVTRLQPLTFDAVLLPCCCANGLT